MDKNLPVDMIIVEPTAIDGEHVEVGTVLKKCETELAMDLAASGKARPATPELIKQYKDLADAKAKAAKAAAEAAEIAATNALGNSAALTKAVADAIANGIKAALSSQQPAAQG